MARGWESKSIEDQIDSREADIRDRKRRRTAPVDAERDARRQTLQLARSRALQELQVACDKRHRALLEQTIEHLDAELSRL
jgi:hypothetical protein